MPKDFYPAEAAIEAAVGRGLDFLRTAEPFSIAMEFMGHEGWDCIRALNGPSETLLNEMFPVDPDLAANRRAEALSALFEQAAKKFGYKQDETKEVKHPHHRERKHSYHSSKAGAFIRKLKLSERPHP